MTRIGGIQRLKFISTKLFKIEQTQKLTTV